MAGLRLCHNFVRSRLWLEGGIASGGATGIIIEGNDEFQTMIQAAAEWFNLKSSVLGWPARSV